MEKEPGKKTGKGGAREGSGRKAVSGMYTKTMRVPTVMEEEVLCLIDMYSNWLKHGKMEKGMARRTTPEPSLAPPFPVFFPGSFSIGLFCLISLRNQS